MIHIKIIKAENLPIITGSVRKTKICCFSCSSFRYLLGEFKNNENTTNPEWNAEFDVDLFRAVTLSFCLYSSRFFSQDVFLGRVDIDLLKYFQSESGKQIINSPQNCIECKFPLTSCSSSNSILTLSFSYIPITYRPIKFDQIPDPVIHLWASFNPPIELNDQLSESPIEIDILQAYPIKDEKGEFSQGLYYNFDKSTSWEAIGGSSLSKYFYGPTGLTQIHSFKMPRIEKYYEFFVLNVSNYTGIVTLNFIAEPRGDIKTVQDGHCVIPCKNMNQIGVIQTIDVSCEPNKKYCAPIYMKYEIEARFFYRKYYLFNDFTSLNTEKDSEINTQIIEKAKELIPMIKDVNFVQTKTLTNIEKVSLSKTCQEFKIESNSNLRVYVGGSNVVYDNDGDDVYNWHPNFIIYDKETHQKCPEINKQIKNLTQKQLKSNKIYNFRWNFCNDINLNQFDTNKIIIFIISCTNPLETSNNDGYFLISQVNDNNETLLFRNMVYADGYCSSYATCFRLEYIDEDWNICPMRHYFQKKDQMEKAIDSMISNDWKLNQTYADQIKKPQ